MMVGLGPMDATSSYSRLILFDIAGTTFISTIFMIFHAMSVSGSRVPDQTDQSGQRCKITREAESPATTTAKQ